MRRATTWALTLALLVSVSTWAVAPLSSSPRESAPENADTLNVSLTTDRQEYRLGETVVFTLSNREGNYLVFFPRLTERFLNGTWKLVECAFVAMVDRFLPPGESRSWNWTVWSQDPEEGCAYFGGFPPVEPGLYRGGAGVAWECFGESGCKPAGVHLYAEFSVIV